MNPTKPTLLTPMRLPTAEEMALRTRFLQSMGMDNNSMASRAMTGYGDLLAARDDARAGLRDSAMAGLAKAFGQGDKAAAGAAAGGTGTWAKLKSL